MSSSLYETFGSEINYKFTAGKLEAYLDNASVKFPLPEASSEILAELAKVKEIAIDPQKLDVIKKKLMHIKYDDKEISLTGSKNLYDENSNLIGELRSACYSPHFQMVIGIAMIHKSHWKEFQGFKIQINEVQNVDPTAYFDMNADTLKLSVDAFEAMNAIRPAGNKVDLKEPLDNSRSKVAKLIKA